MEFKSKTYRTKDQEWAEEQWGYDVDESFEKNQEEWGQISILGKEVYWFDKKFKTVGEAKEFIMCNQRRVTDGAFGVEISGGWVIGGWCRN